MWESRNNPFHMHALQHSMQHNDEQSESQEVQRIIAILLRDKQPMTVNGIHSQMRNGKRKMFMAIIEAHPENFEIYTDGDGQTYVKLITNLGLCENHCSKNQTCNGMNCSALHICKFYILSGECRFGGRCHFGHDLTTSHNSALLRQNNLDRIAFADLRFLLKQPDNRQTVTVPKICKFYNVQKGCRATEKEHSCPNLHICNHYVRNNCRFGKNCKRNHNVCDPGVRLALDRFGFNTKRSPKEILSELRDALGDNDEDEAAAETGSQQRQPQPSCSGIANLNLQYDDTNSSSGESTSSMPDRSRNRRQRKRARNQGQQNPGKVRRGVSREISMDNNSGQLICLYNLRGKCCAFGKSCRNAHYNMPYQWLYKTQADSDWTEVGMSDNQEIELDFSDPGTSEHYLKMSNGNLLSITFKTMLGTDADGETYQVVRKSTESSVVAERQTLATNWIWSWKMQSGEWKQYGDSDMGYHSEIMSNDIEQQFMANPEGQIKFATQGHEYLLDFRKMVQCNLHYRTVREVRRRPAFVKKAEVEKRIKQQLSHMGRKNLPPGGPKADVALVTAPPHWSIDDDTDILDHCQKVQISRKNYRQEYDKIEKLFCESMPSTVSIKSIERIENGDLWANFESKKIRMKKKSKTKDVDERRLFHGTISDYVDPICRQGFDFRLSGQSAGTVHGKGSYFATTSKFSDCYTNADDKIMFIVRVLVGEFVKSDRKYVRPPRKDADNPCSDLYDSCVDNMDKPKIFIIFDNNGQVYPEYVIKYEMRY